MRIEHIQITNYKGFRDSGRIAIGSKFTVLVGQNNAGKTAFLEALNTRDLKHVPFKEPDDPESRFPRVPNPRSSITFGASFTGPELKWRLLSGGGNFRMVAAGSNPSDILQLVREFLSRPEIRLDAKYFPGGWEPSAQPMFPFSEHADHNFTVLADPARQDISITNLTAGIQENVVQALLGPYLQDAVYLFRAERMNVGECSIEGSVELAPNASNLASVLLQLNASPLALERFTNYIRDVFPTIFSVVSRPKPDQPSIARIEVINRDIQSSEWHPGISIPLADSGTGISQVLAILYVVVTARTSRVIVIDEPNTFIHPRAARKLLAILKEREHQYIITTHSPDIIRAADPEVLCLVKWTGRESVIEALNVSDANNLHRVLSELGVKLSDVFGADNVLWVEGRTEEICFPRLLQHVNQSKPAALTAVVGMVNTGDFEGRRVRRSLAWEVYERLSVGSALIPPALAFSFDQEGRTAIEIEDMKRRSSREGTFLAEIDA